MSERELAALLDALSPKNLRERFGMPHASWREEFTPRFLRSGSFEEMLDELGRFVAHVEQRWFGDRVVLPLDRARGTAARILNQMVKSSRNQRAGEYMAMAVCRHGDQGGMRHVLDILLRGLLDDHLRQYLDHVVLARIRALPASQSLRLAELYRQTFSVLPECEIESPAAIVLRWPEVIHSHAHAVLKGRSVA